MRCTRRRSIGGRNGELPLDVRRGGRAAGDPGRSSLEGRVGSKVSTHVWIVDPGLRKLNESRVTGLEGTCSGSRIAGPDSLETPGDHLEFDVPRVVELVLEDLRVTPARTTDKTGHDFSSIDRRAKPGRASHEAEH